MHVAVRRLSIAVRGDPWSSDPKVNLAVTWQGLYRGFVLRVDVGGCRGPQPPLAKMLNFEVDLI